MQEARNPQKYLVHYEKYYVCIKNVSQRALDFLFAVPGNFSF